MKKKKPKTFKPRQRPGRFKLLDLVIVIVVFVVLGTVFLLRSRAVSPHRSLPGQVAWNNGATSTLFGENDTYRYSATNAGTTPSIVQQTADAHIGVIRTWFFKSEYDARNKVWVPTSDDMINERLTTAEKTGATTIVCVLRDIMDEDLPRLKHFVTVAGNRCDMYEFGNESDTVQYWDPSANGGQGAWVQPWPWGVEKYIDLWKTAIPQLRQINPNAKFGALVSPGLTNFQAWIDWFGPATNTADAKAQGYYPDFMSWHEYYGGDGHSWQQVIAEVPNQVKSTATAARSKVDQYYDSGMPLINSEWGMLGGEDQNYVNRLRSDPNAFQYQHDFIMAVEDALTQSGLDLAVHFDWAQGNGKLFDSFDVGDPDLALPGNPNGQFFGMKDAIAKYRDGTAQPPADTTPPTVSLSAPQANATLTGAVNLSATASDNVGVAKVEFYDGSTLLGTSTTSPYVYRWDTTQTTSTTRTLTAKAYDGAGNSASSSAVTVTVNNSPPPPVGQPDLVVTSLTTSPTTPKAGDKVNITVTIKNVGTAPTPNGIEHDVSLRIDGAEVTWVIDYAAVLNPGDSVTLSTNAGTTAGPWTATQGPHTLEAYVDNLGRITESDETNNKFPVPPLSFTVTAPVSPPPPKIGDLNNDGKVNIFDLGIFLNKYGTHTTTGDLNHDNVVNIFDLGIFLSKYGQ